MCPFIPFHLKKCRPNGCFNMIQFTQRLFYANSHEHNENWANKNLCTYFCMHMESCVRGKNYTTCVPTDENYVGILSFPNV